MAVLSRLLAGLLATVAVNATPFTLQNRGTIASDEIVGFAQTVPSGTVGDVYLAYQPYLYVVNGCVPFPAVDAEGDTNAGLATTGASNGDCSSSTGQIYVRGTTYDDYYALMYSWYMPKDEPSDGLGHRHDWEGVIIWLTSSTATTAANIVGVCPSAHGNWDCSTDGFTLSGTAALIDYESIWPLDHSCGLTTTVGGTQPLIAWESLPTVAQTALDDTDFGSAIVPFIDAHFTTNLAAATF
ncbi:npp1 domain-containing protein [Mollisia scopiformis]|uniref:Npp1 domain-containing protein n=1 Tax=Mollisia scopiformis TaxID=149040 RepID=A0A194XKQ0_MOLSC|nr:npp1 domain-containing protein [Mollisia scopiformis]KUJ20716.1 npp1 domain-containing protein [Mollisia scopiformis]